MKKLLFILCTILGLGICSVFAINVVYDSNNGNEVFGEYVKTVGNNIYCKTATIYGANRNIIKIVSIDKDLPEDFSMSKYGLTPDLTDYVLISVEQ